MLAACSTTSRLTDDETLYTGLRGVEIQGYDGAAVPDLLKGEIRHAVGVKPNNALTPSFRYPFPLGLWVWNHWKEPNGGIGKWLYDKMVAQPVLISDVRPDLRVKMLDQLLDRNGYFRGTATYELVTEKNPRKAGVRYNVQTGPAYPLDSIELLPDTCRLNHLIDSVARRSEYLRRGERFSVDSLKNLRARIADVMRNRGYYYFRPEYIEYLADTLLVPGSVTLRLTLADNIPAPLLYSYVTGDITTVIHRYEGGGTPDTVSTRRGDLVVMQPTKLRQKLIPECIAFRPGRTFTVRDLNRTQTYLSRTGIFNGIDIQAVPDTAAARPTLNVTIDCTVDRPWEATIEANATSKSNSYLGPGLILGLTNKNTFGGGEQLSLRLTGSYEWQTGRGSHSSVFNSYEFGLNGTLAFPRLLAPRWFTRGHRYLNWTRIQLGGEVLNRPHYFRLAQFDLGLTYDWQRSRHVSNSWTLFKLSYNKLLNTTAAFDSIMTANPAIALSFRDQYVPQMAWTWTYDRTYRNGNSLTVTTTLQEAGNIFWAAYRLAGDKGEKRLFGTPFSQFIKGQAQVVYGWKINDSNLRLVSRLLVGAAHAYGNSTQVPYSDQFYIGGANSIRAFTVRSLGPGSFRPAAGTANGYFDQTGTFKLEANAELRFPLISMLYGAFFVDTGNIWLLKKDPLRPGGELRARTFWRDLALGTGVGLRLDISMLVVRLDLGIGIHAPYDTGHRGYYNMTSPGKSMALHLAIGYPF